MNLRAGVLVTSFVLTLAQHAGAGSPDCTKTDALTPNLKCRWLTPAGTLQIAANRLKSTLQLSAFNRAGKRLWQEERVDFLQGLRLMDNVLVVDTSNNGIGAYITLQTALISPKLERPVWVWGAHLVSRPADHLALFTQEDVGRPEDEAGLSFQQVVFQPEIKVNVLHFDQPSRPNCGKAHGGWEAFGQPKFTQRYVYVVRQDECGYFMTRFDWVTPDAVPFSYAVPAPE